LMRVNVALSPPVRRLEDSMFFVREPGADDGWPNVRLRGRRRGIRPYRPPGAGLRTAQNGVRAGLARR
jgi:hypothetical protein